ncbi:MAG: hypothetical protein JWR54_1639, partial [Mucilaginibacter sp.]|nr:hypothetical protein [Mucilaginibacter sp.]
DSVDYKLLFYSSPLPILIYDLKTMQILDVNKMATEFYGYSRDEFLSMTVKDIRPAEEIPLVIKVLKEIVFNSEVSNLGTWNLPKKMGSLLKLKL